MVDRYEPRHAVPPEERRMRIARRAIRTASVIGAFSLLQPAGAVSPEPDDRRMPIESAARLTCDAARRTEFYDSFGRLAVMRRKVCATEGTAMTAWVEPDKEPRVSADSIGDDEIFVADCQTDEINRIFKRSLPEKDRVGVNAWIKVRTDEDDDSTPRRHMWIVDPPRIDWDQQLPRMDRSAEEWEKKRKISGVFVADNSVVGRVATRCALHESSI